jgi:hypothetical protein
MTRWQWLPAVFACCLCLSGKALSAESLPTRSVIFAADDSKVGLWARNFSPAPFLVSRCPITRAHPDVSVSCRPALSLDDVAHTKYDKERLSKIIRGENFDSGSSEPDDFLSDVAVSIKEYPRLVRRFYMFDEPVAVTAILSNPRKASRYPTRDALNKAIRNSRFVESSLNDVLNWALMAMVTTQSFESVDTNDTIERLGILGEGS